MRKIAVPSLVSLGALLTGPIMANEFAEDLQGLAKSSIAAIAQSPEVIAAVKAQNGQTSGYDQAKIDDLDSRWRREVDASSRPMIDTVMANPLSKFLKAQQDETQGLFTEIFVMDALGLNVGQSEITSDYWQGDEGKWQNTFSAGAGAVDISEVEKDDSTQVFQSQVSVPVLDEQGAAIGAITIGVNVEFL